LELVLSLFHIVDITNSNCYSINYWYYYTDISVQLLISVSILNVDISNLSELLISLSRIIDINN